MSRRLPVLAVDAGQFIAYRLLPLAVFRGFEVAVDKRV